VLAEIGLQRESDELCAAFGAMVCDEFVEDVHGAGVESDLDGNGGSRGGSCLEQGEQPGLVSPRAAA